MSEAHHNPGQPRRAIVMAMSLAACLMQACTPERPAPKTDKKTANKQDARKPVAWKGEDILALWATRFGKVPAGAFDTAIPKLEEKELRQVLDRYFTALSTGRNMQRFARTAREELLAEPAQAVAGLAAFLSDSENDEANRARALALFAGKPHPLLTTLCLQHLDDRQRLVRLECVRRLRETKSIGVVPRLLRRTREFYEEDPEILTAIYVSLAQVGNLSGMETLLSWLSREDMRAHAGTALIDIVALYGPAYVETDGWSGLAKKGQVIQDTWKREGRVPLLEPERTLSIEDRYLLDREFWLFLRHLSEKDLRVVDETRFIGQHAGNAMVPLLRESLRDQRLHQRYHALEVFMTLGPVGKSAEKEIHALLTPPLTRNYALNAYGCIHGEGALGLLLGVLRTSSDQEEQIGALAGLSGLEAPAAFDYLRERFHAEKSVELKAWVAKAWVASGRGARQEARTYLQKLLDDKAFHEPTLLDMLREAHR
jgi:hypothetical protein